jgi:hypothetical protein
MSEVPKINKEYYLSQFREMFVNNKDAFSVRLSIQALVLGNLDKDIMDDKVAKNFADMYDSNFDGVKTQVLRLSEEKKVDEAIKFTADKFKNYLSELKEKQVDAA